MADHQSPDKEPVIRVKNLYKSFRVGQNEIEALRGIELEVYATDFLVIFGPSGCGKSTLLNLILGIDTPSNGTIIVRDTDLFALPEDERSVYRARKIGMVYQMPYWVKSLNVIENVALPLIIEGLKIRPSMKRAEKMLEELGIPELSKQLPTQLSGGEQQRVGLARALVTNPWIIMADEPTGNLDSQNAKDIMDMLRKLNSEQKRTIILVTHNEEYWNYGTRRIEMKDGQITKDTDTRNIKAEI